MVFVRTAVHGGTGAALARSRYRNRGKDSQPHGDRRARNDLCAQFDYVIVNDDLDLAVRDLLAIFTAERCRNK